MKPEFYVIRLGRNVDPNKLAIGLQAPVAARAPRAPRRNEIDVDAPEQILGADDQAGYGQEIARTELRDPVIRFTTEEAAERHAAELAEKSPKTLFAVLGVLRVFETTVPTVIEKRFNDKGELILSE